MPVATVASVKRLAVFSWLAVMASSPDAARAEDPGALWRIVDGQCVPHQWENGHPSPCVQLDLRPEAGYAVLKDRVGIAQYLVIPTTRLSGVESPELLAEGAPNYWAFAWQARGFVEERLQRKLGREQIALAVNSAFGRSQNQLHIHIDCIREDIRAILWRHMAEIGREWAPLAVSLNGHPYWARRILGPDLGDNNPFKLLAEGLPAAGRQMDRRTLVLTGATFDDDGEGFILLTDSADPGWAHRASGEELQDHRCAGIER